MEMPVLRMMNRYRFRGLILSDGVIPVSDAAAAVVVRLGL